MSLAFDFDVYISDEVTATGVTAFRNKALAAFKKIADHSGLIMVSQAEGTLKESCRAGVWLHEGHAHWFDNISDALRGIQFERQEMSAEQGLIGRLYDRLGTRLGAWLGSASIPRQTTRATVVACALAILYWGFLASDRYVSEAHIVVPRIDVAGAPSMDLGSILTGATGGGRRDQMLLRSYLLSVDMLNRLDQALGCARSVALNFAAV